MKVIEKKNLLPFCLVTSLFLLWGIAKNMTDTLLSAFKKIMSMSDTQTSLIQFAFYGSPRTGIGEGAQVERSETWEGPSARKCASPEDGLCHLLRSR